MALDPTLILRGIAPPTPVQSPIEALSALEQLRAGREQTEARRLAGEERRAKAQEDAAKRQREEQVQATLREAVTFGPDGAPTVDWGKLTGHLDPGVAFEVKKTIDEAATRTATLGAAKLTAAEKTTQYLGMVAKPVQVGQYDKKLFDLAATAAFNAGALTADQRDAAYAMTDPAEIKRATDAAIAAAGGKADEGFTLSAGQVRYGPGGQIIATGPAKPPGEGAKFQDVDAIVKFPDGKTYTGKVGYNPDLNVYSPIGSTEPFPPGTTVERQPTPVDPLVAAIRGLTVQTLREQADTMTPAQATYAKSLADDYTKASEDYVVRAQSHQTLKGAAANPSAAGDIVMIFAFMRQQDPKSTVREGEFATAQNSAGVPEQIRNLYNKVLSGTRLSPAQRADFVGQSERIFKAAQQRQQGLRTIYAKRAENMHLNPADVVIDYDQLFGLTGEGQAKTPAPIVSSGAPSAAPKKNPFVK